jgi:hypothetical protein
MGTGVGEAMLISAAVGAGTGAAGSAISGGDPLKGALTGAALGAVTGGVGAGFSGAASTGANIAGTATETALNEQIAKEALMGGTSATAESGIPAAINSAPAYGAGSGIPNTTGQAFGAGSGIDTIPTYQYGGPQGNLLNPSATSPETLNALAAKNGVFPEGASNLIGETPTDINASRLANVSQLPSNAPINPSYNGPSFAEQVSSQPVQPQP